MERLSISFYPELYETLAERAKSKRLSLAQYVRQLVEAGLKSEAQAEEPTTPKIDINLLTKTLVFQQKLLKKEFLSMQETLYLTRYVLAHSPETAQGEHQEMLKKARLKAQSLLEVLLEENN